jgi:hypothetical protein
VFMLVGLLNMYSGSDDPTTHVVPLWCCVFVCFWFGSYSIWW